MIHSALIRHVAVRRSAVGRQILNIGAGILVDAGALLAHDRRAVRLKIALLIVIAAVTAAFEGAWR